MKYLKMLGLAAIAAAALMAFVGASSASATELCSTNSSPCSGTVYGVGTKIHAVLTPETEAVLKAGFATVKCKESTTEGEVEKFNGSGNPEGPISTLTFGNCNCVVTVGANGSLEVTAKGAGNGSLVGRGTKTTINCSGVSCNFGTAAAGTNLGEVVGGNPAEFKANAKLPWQEGDSSNSVCTLGTGTGAWTTTEGKGYEITTPKPLFVV